MSFGSPTPVEVAVSGPNFAESRAYAEQGVATNWPRVRGAPRPAVRPVARLSDDRGATSTARRRASADVLAGRRRPRRWSRPRRRAASSCRTTGPTRRPASATRCRSRCPAGRPHATRHQAVGSIADLEPIPVKRTGAGPGPACATWPRCPARHDARPVSTATT